MNRHWREKRQCLSPAFFFVLEKAVKSAGNLPYKTPTQYASLYRYTRKHFHSHSSISVLLWTISHKRRTFAFTGESGYTLGFRRRITHKGSQGETRGLPDGAAITTLGPFHTFRKPCVAGYQNGKLCRFWVLAGCAPEERREPAGQRCAHVRRCSEASRPRWAA